MIGSQHGSTHSHLRTPTSASKALLRTASWKRVIEEGGDNEIDGADFEEVRCEIQATGYHLTSVLMNPRETLFDNIFDEFATEQSLPLDYQSPISSGGSLFSSSVHASSHSTSHTATPSSTSSRNGGIVLTLTASETEQLNRFIRRMHQVFKIYLGAHGQEVLQKSSATLNSARNQQPQHAKTQHPFSTPLSSPKSSHHNLHQANGHHHHRHGAHHVPGRTPRKTHQSSGEELALCYLHVPDVFFRPDFSLMKQEIFNQAILFVAPNERQLTRYDPSASAQEKLSHYLDLVEVALLRQIWSRSPAFFRALDDLKGLQHDVYVAIQGIKHVRARLQRVTQETTVSAMAIPGAARRHRNSNQLHTKLLHLHQWMQGRLAILALVEVEDYFSSHELLFSIRRIYQEHLQGITSIKALATQLNDVEAGIIEVLCNKLVTMAIQWIEPVVYSQQQSQSQQPQQQTAQQRLDQEINEELNALFPANKKPADEQNQRHLLLLQEQEELCARLLQSLVASEALLPALNMYKTRLLDGLRLILRTCVMEYISQFDPSQGIFDSGDHMSGMLSHDDMSILAGGDGAGGAGGGTPYAQRVRDMSTENFLSCLSMCFEQCMTSLKKAEDFHRILSKHINNSSSEQQQPSLTSTLDNLQEALTSEFRFSRTTTAAPSPAPSDDPNNSNANNNSSGSAVAQALRQLSQPSRQRLLDFSKSILQAASEAVQKSVVQLLNYRKDLTAKFEPFRMKYLWEISLTFVLCLEQCSTSTATALRNCLLGQSRAFLDQLHETSKHRLIASLDNERWIQFDVTSERQRELDRLSSGKAFLVSTSNNNNSSSSSNDSNNSNNGSSNGNNGNNSNNNSAAAANIAGGKKKDKEARSAFVDHAEYKVVWTVLLLTEIVLSYLDIAFHFAPLSSDVIHKVVEQIRLFDTRTRQLVLGAQAMQSAARLKSISAKHLAVTGRSLGLFISLLPHIRAALVAQIPPKLHVLLAELDRVSQELFDHHAAIVAKFVAIISDTVEVSAGRLRSFEWDRSLASSSTVAKGGGDQAADDNNNNNNSNNSSNNNSINNTNNNTNNSSDSPAPAPASTTTAVAPPVLACEYFEEISRNVSTLHKVLVVILPPEQIADVFFRIFGMLNRRIHAHFEDIMPVSFIGKQRVVDEVTHLVTTLSRLKHVDGSVLSSQLEESMRKKYSYGNVSSGGVRASILSATTTAAGPPPPPST